MQEPEILNTMLYGANNIGRLGFLDAQDAGECTYIFVKNTGNIPLSGFELESGGFTIIPRVRPDILLPYSEGLIVTYANKIVKPSTLTIKTKQGALLHLQIS